jgi:hypothetical protein
VAYGGSATDDLCLDGGGVQQGHSVKIAPCIKPTDPAAAMKNLGDPVQPFGDTNNLRQSPPPAPPGQLWEYDLRSQRLVNIETKLCIDPMRYDHAIYPETGRGKANSNWPVAMQPCGRSKHQRIVITEVDTEDAARAAEGRMREGRKWGDGGH